MTAQAFQNKTQTKTRSGSRGKRRGLPPGGGLRQPSRGRRRQSEKRNKGARVIWMIMIIGGMIGGIFIFAQRSQINTMYLKRTEESLKSEIDTLASQQRYLNFQKEKALSTQESGKVASEFGLIQPGVGRAVAQRTEPEAKAVSETKVAAKPGAAKAAKATKVVAKQSVPAKQPGKLAKSAKVVAGKGSKTAKPTQAKPAQARKDSKQLAKNQPAKNLAAKNLATKNLAAKNEASRKAARR